MYLSLYTYIYIYIYGERDITCVYIYMTLIRLTITSVRMSINRIIVSISIIEEIINRLAAVYTPVAMCGSFAMAA